MIEVVLRRVLVLIGVATVVTGLTQLVVPEWVLGIVHANTSATSAHFFATVGMFMVLFGGVLLHALWSGRHYPLVVFWTALQKLGASALVYLGVKNGVFGAIALGVCGFDFLSGLIAFWYWRKIMTKEGR